MTELPPDDPRVRDAFDRLRADAGTLSTDEARRRLEPRTAGRWRPVLAALSVVAIVAVGVLVSRDGDDTADVVASDAADDSDGADDTDVPVVRPDAADLLDTTWVLANGEGPAGTVLPIDDWPVTIQFSDSEQGALFGGVAACNGYGGPYELEAGALVLGEWGANAAGCEPEVMAVEAAFFAALTAVDSVELIGDKLIFRGDGAELLFIRDVPAPVAEIVGRTWLLTDLVQGDDRSPAGGEPATLELRADGSMVGGTGCRLLSGEWIASAASIVFPSFGADGECSLDLRDQDGLVVAVLGDGFTAVVDGDVLELSSVGNEGLVYRLTEDDVVSSTQPPRNLAAELASTRWTLIAGSTPDGEVPIDDTWRVTLDFDPGGGAVSGFAPCRPYAAGLRPVYDGGAVQQIDVDGTARCETDATLGPWEQAYEDALLSVDEVVLEPEELILIGPDTELRFVRRPALTVTELLDQRPSMVVEVTGQLADRGGGVYLCDVAIDQDGNCRGRFVAIAGSAVVADEGEAVLSGRLTGDGRLLLEGDTELEPTEADAAVADALGRGALDDPALTWHPEGVVLAIGGTAVQETRTPAELVDPASWMLNDPRGFFRGRDGPFSVLSVLAGDVDPLLEREVAVRIGTHAHCAAPPMPLPEVDFSRQLVIEADGIDSCLQWFVVDVLFDGEDRIVAVNLDLWEP